MRTLIIPDVHQKLDKLSRIINNNTFDRLISLGDWFDDFYDTPEQTENTARYIVDLYSKYGDNFIWLLGNHDIPYLYPATYDRHACSGNTREKLKAINSVFQGSTVIGYSPKLAYRLEIEGCYDLLLSHAGASEHHFAKPFTDELTAKDIIERCEVAERLLAMGLDDPILSAGIARGGREVVGGITWMDWRYEYEPIPTLSQIVGHTPLATPEVLDAYRTTIAPDSDVVSISKYILKPGTSYNINIDTHLDHYITIENNELLIHKTAALE
jgi:hypothetical protein